MQLIDPKIDALIAYAGQYHPPFASAIEGVPADQIAAYEKLAGYPVPQIFRSYLARMGCNNGGLAFNWDGWHDLRHLTGYYEDGIEENEAIAPDDCIIVWRGGLSDDVGLMVSGESQGRVVFIDDMTEIDGFCAESFEKLLYKCVFTRYRQFAFRHRQFYVSSYESTGRQFVLPQASAHAERLGFKREWFSDHILFCGERDGTAIALGQKEHDGLYLIVAGDDLHSAREIGANFLQFGLEKQAD
jgi:hypothetical protein